MLIYQEENYTPDFFREAWDLFVAHWNEVGVFKDKMELFPNEDLYEQLATMGLLKLYVVRHDGVIAGYSAFIIQQHPHYVTTKVAMNDILYVKPEYRKGSLSLKLMNFAEKNLQKEGVQFISMHSKTEHDFGVILRRKGYQPVETIYGKYIGE